jgi:hypothetical protein
MGSLQEEREKRRQLSPRVLFERLREVLAGARRSSGEDCLDLDELVARSADPLACKTCPRSLTVADEVAPGRCLTCQRGDVAHE